MRKEDIKIFNSLTDAQLLALNIEREASNQPREGQIAIGTVVLERVDHRNWDGKTIHEVILKSWQFSWTMPEAGVAYYKDAVLIAKNFDLALQRKLKNAKKETIGIALKECYDIAVGMLDGSIPRDPDLASIHCCQYLNPKDPWAAKTKKEWLAKGMRVFKTIKDHEFFDDKTK